MEWERAKSYLLIFFVLLNIGLGGLLFMENRRYTMTGEQERLIRTIMNQNGIGMYTIMRRFPPMRHLDVSGFYYDEDAIIQILFDNPQAVLRHSNHQIFEYGNSRLTISNGFISYENPDGFRNGFGSTIDEINLAMARTLTDVFINTYFADFRLDTTFEEERGIRLTYHQEYRGQLVHSNFIAFFVTPIGIEQIEMQFGRIIGHSGDLRMLVSPDEALLTFVQRVRHFTQETPMTIVHMDLVYFQEYLSDQEGGVYHAIPFYRIFTACSGDRPYLINAFFNVIID